MRLHYTLIADWPPLAWLARWHPRDDVLEVRHGRRVETHPDWFGEVVWAGAYTAGDFDRTDLVFGSGARVRDGLVTFVSAGSTVDRLLSLEQPDLNRVSNSLPCLLADAGGSVDPADPDYFSAFRSISLGLDRYQKCLPTGAGPVRLTYFYNLIWTGLGLVEADKRFVRRKLPTFELYRDFLRASLGRLAENMACTARRHRYQLLGTVSSGFDSAAVTALGRVCGLRQVITFDRSSDGYPDTGEAIGRILGVDVAVISRDAWRRRGGVEVPFIAADAKGEDVPLAGAEAFLFGRVLLTGYHGDRMWAMHNRALSPDIVRSDQSGLSLAEFRLRAGFIHCPVPFFAVRQIADVHAISHSPAMRRWDVSGRYNRPIARRIVEEAGVPRGEFALRKQAVSVLFFLEKRGLSEPARAEYAAWIEARAAAWRTRGRRPPRLGVSSVNLLKAVFRGVARGLRIIAQLAPRQLGILQELGDRIADAGWRQAPFRYAFPWALERMIESYLTPALRVHSQVAPQPNIPGRTADQDAKRPGLDDPAPLAVQ
jgi:hypothetical protein